LESIITRGRIPAGALENLGRVNVLTDRVKKRRQECLFSVPHLCAERSRLVTECWKETEGLPLVLRRARLFQKIMENLTISIREGELIVGSQSKYIRGAAPPIDYSPESLLATLGSEKLTLQGEVAEGAVTPEEKQSLLKDAEFWNGRAPGQILKDLVLSQLPELEGYIKANLLNDGPFTTSCVGRCLEYSKILKLGIKGIRGEIDRL
jgi:pyruvate-formate lyase